MARGDRDQLVILTGPNMAGKSTWMRQLALIVLLAQAGSFVPAQSARIGLVDGIFTRIGAVDDLAGGRSTFMIEMEETATVLRAATDRSLIVLDEIGRGTSTHDGMAIAWSVAEYLATGPVRPRAVVATHYHELAALADVHPQVSLLRATVEERPEGITLPAPDRAGRRRPQLRHRGGAAGWVCRRRCWSVPVRWPTPSSRSARRSPAASAAPHIPRADPDRVCPSSLGGSRTSWRGCAYRCRACRPHPR